MSANAKSSSAARTSRRPLTVLAACAAILLASAVPALAAERAMTQEEIGREIQRAEDYFNDIETMQARFVQVSSDGTYGEGDVYLDRPGNMRFEYDPPIPVLLLANGSTFLYYDKKLEQASFVPLWDTPLWFLLDEETNFTSSDAPVEITHIQRTEDLLILTLVDPSEEYQGKLELIFSRDPYAFKSWRVIDDRGIETEVTLVGMEQGVDLSGRLFSHEGLPGTGFERGPGK
ncbi:MAG: outer membrane lipoprotein carrier protein LolA [Rhodovibrionaceae bacterium]